jgi:hypothetical protein
MGKISGVKREGLMEGRKGQDGRVAVRLKWYGTKVPIFALMSKVASFVVKSECKTRIQSKRGGYRSDERTDAGGSP